VAASLVDCPSTVRLPVLVSAQSVMIPVSGSSARCALNHPRRLRRRAQWIYFLVGERASAAIICLDPLPRHSLGGQGAGEGGGARARHDQGWEH
jgi:hypothetical protein